ncbi:hypothetical protein D3C72_1649530 [compost metagenome]
MRDRSRVSLMVRSSVAEDCCMVSRYCCCWLSIAVRLSISSVPRIPNRGVRISWLMVARNTVFAWLAASACSLAWVMVRSTRLKAVMSLMPHRTASTP